MAVGVVDEVMTLGDDAAEEIRILFGPLAGRSEAGLDALGFEDVDLRGEPDVGARIESERNDLAAVGTSANSQGGGYRVAAPSSSIHPETVGAVTVAESGRVVVGAAVLVVGSTRPEVVLDASGTDSGPLAAGRRYTP